MSSNAKQPQTSSNGTPVQKSQKTAGETGSNVTEDPSATAGKTKRKKRNNNRKNNKQDAMNNFLAKMHGDSG